MASPLETSATNCATTIAWSATPKAPASPQISRQMSRTAIALSGIASPLFGLIVYTHAMSLASIPDEGSVSERARLDR